MSNEEDRKNSKKEKKMTTYYRIERVEISGKRNREKWLGEFNTQMTIQKKKQGTNS